MNFVPTSNFQSAFVWFVCDDSNSPCRFISSAWVFRIVMDCNYCVVSLIWECCRVALVTIYTDGKRKWIYTGCEQYLFRKATMCSREVTKEDQKYFFSTAWVMPGAILGIFAQAMPVQPEKSGGRRIIWDARLTLRWYHSWPCYPDCSYKHFGPVLPTWVNVDCRRVIEWQYL